MNNKYKPHLVILPEDDANRQIALGFENNEKLNSRVIQILSEAGGWKDVVKTFTDDYVSKMRQYPERRMVLLIDFDEKDYNYRLDYVKQHIPNDLEDRVFVIGVSDDPEELRRNTGKSFEKIGETLANDCAENTNKLWGHKLLKHNKAELDRMIISVKPFLLN
ncbi:conserved hypothetical protein [Rippkaea orientalis PCC 8801]|uniref:Uncharacterized protein n=1 Tax=Rippkaea orientalis (strain PCC 8801 / RF-1) TaxID=41431 RepID=B7JV04_RIPO1|nr:hypothetical protein [Rippkaea orientalis]ACK66856.1 conserved hypothetical protein [Rippkaea orientalis PCC 8801]